MPTVLLADPVYKEHDTGPGHPERPERYDAVAHALDQAGLTKSLRRIEARSATEDEIALQGSRLRSEPERELGAGIEEVGRAAAPGAEANPISANAPHWSSGELPAPV